ncbi:MAG TPA: GatB/YqeY domain-containing protein [Candidatus Dormibacteraeota bacterium]|jgi:hypothetical protein|nr:GatB/YqeY domain-containing protein [Candidatus Dormibacteraeota bacterium]
MSAFTERIDADLIAARRRRDDLAVRTLGLLKSELVTAAKEPGAGVLDEEAAMRVVRRELKRRQEAAEAFAAAGREESARSERKEGELLSAYLPAEMDEAELEREVRAVVTQLGATSPRDMGSVMKAARERLAGKAEQGRIAAIARRLLAG